MKLAVWARALALPLVVLLGGCGGAESNEPAWLAELPERTIEAAAGERVWAVVPEQGSEAARLATYRIAETSGTESVLVDDLGNRFEGVPGALVHPLSGFPEAELAVGVAVLADRWDAAKVVGRVSRIEDGEVEITFDWNGSTAVGAMDAVMPLPAGDGLILRWVAYPGSDAATWHKGLCFAESDDRLWISDDGGHVEVVAKDSVKLLDDLGRELQVGATVSAYCWDHGFRQGVIAEVLEPGLRFAVRTEDGETRPFFFEDLTAAF